MTQHFFGSPSRWLETNEIDDSFRFQPIKAILNTSFKCLKCRTDVEMSRWDDTAHLDDVTFRHFSFKTTFDDAFNFRWRLEMSLWICRILNTSDRQIFWCRHDEHNTRAPKLYRLAWLANGYPQGRIYKICIIFGQLVYFSFFLFWFIQELEG